MLPGEWMLSAKFLSSFLLLPVEALALARVTSLETGIHLLSDFVKEQPGGSFIEPAAVEIA